MEKINIGVIGLGYVGFPVFFELSKKFKTIGLDIDLKRINSLSRGLDKNNQYPKFNGKNLNLTTNFNDLKKCNIFIVTVPTPIKKNNEPDLSPLKKACISIGKIMRKNSIIIFESTVYPGCTESICIPILSKFSSLKFNRDFSCGYSPERINVGDDRYTLTKVNKIISSSNKKSLSLIKKIYKSIIKSKLHVASSIKVAEAAKLIENIQRDINIAFVNELSIIFKKLKIDTNEVLDAAVTKWNFHKYFPGLVGGHCIGVDPYYMSHISKKFNYNPRVILAGRRLNENMNKYVISRVEHHKKKFFNKKKIKILILGVTFKENCNDIRNSKVIPIYKKLIKNGNKVDIYDPYIDKKELKRFHNINPINKIKRKAYDYCLIAVRHKDFLKLNKKKLISFMKQKYFIYDLKNCLKFNVQNYERL